ncbi:hypothetical protein [Micromonospora sp. NPDC049301]|uniref:hypothetical protein n=1 Tax=Micromonospora sp. NPDC049301 TaxID=3155723 RepID=UPI00342FE76B
MEDANGPMIALVGTIAGVVGAIAAILQVLQSRRRAAAETDPSAADVKSWPRTDSRAHRVLSDRWESLTNELRDANEDAAGLFWASLIPVVLELLAWIVLVSANIKLGTLVAIICMALPILLAAIAAFLSAIQVLVAIVEEEIGSGILASTAAILSFIVILTSLDIAGVLHLERLWS